MFIDYVQGIKMIGFFCHSISRGTPEKPSHLFYDHFSSHFCGRIIVHPDMALVTIGNHTRDQSFYKININVTKNRPVEFVTIFRPPIKGTIFRPF